ncbi:MAG: DnaJ domain-containing protein [Patescibacteria group bacterium]
MTKDFYEVLGVGRNCSPSEIKQAFRRLAHQHHPDKGGAKEQFQTINEAYQTLSDPQKGAQYDLFGSVGGAGSGCAGGQAGPGGGFDGFDFGNFGGSRVNVNFGGGIGSIFEDLFESALSQVQVQLQISIPQAVLGDRIRFRTQFGDELELNLPAATQEGQSFRFRGKGQTTRRGHGDLTVSIHIEIPKRLSREQKELYERLKNAS